MYLIGNADTYSSVEMWQRVIGMLRATDSVGKALALSCPRHPDTDAEVQQPEDFHRLSPEGGCREACADRLDCGHQCGARCHSEAMHAVFLCEQPCQRRHQPCGHACQKATCGESCGKCMVPLDNVQLPCGHVKHGVACHRTRNMSSIPCDVKVSKPVPGCGHDVIVKCSKDVSGKDFKCPTPCSAPLSCGHPCPGTCGQCNIKDMYNQPVVKHAACTKTCGRKHGTCNHDCNRLCHDGTDCGLCQAPCEVSDIYLSPKCILTPSRYVASTLNARRGAMSLVRRALSRVFGHVSIKATARCPVRLRAVACPATNVVRSSFYAVINVRASAVKYALRTTVKSVA